MYMYRVIEWNNYTSGLLHIELLQNIIGDEPVVFQYTSVFYQLDHHSGYVFCIVYATVFSPFKLQPKTLEHRGEVATPDAVKQSKHLSDVYPLRCIRRERISGQHTLRK